MGEPLESYGLIGDLQSAALVGRHGSIDWLCLPRFDSDACFAALLGDSGNGRWLIEPADGGRATQRYRGETLILETDWETDDGDVRVIDFMPPRGRAPDVVRIVEGLRGEVAVHSELAIRLGYGKVVPWVHRAGGGLLAVAGADGLCFHTRAETHGENLRTHSRLTVREGERVPFVLTWFEPHHEVPPEIDAEKALRETEEFWDGWLKDCGYEGPYRTAVRRSLVVLKALTYGPTGGIVAAPTTSLPERIGGVRNWDYRFCWLRDATLTLLALLDAGYSDEARAWRDWLLRAVAGDPAEVQVLYRVAGERRATELELDWLSGYEGSTPVRIGNEASRQLQLDVYGEVLEALFQARQHDIDADEHAWALQRHLLRHLEREWRRPDHGIWEIRGEPRHFTHSKVMAWVAFDRACRTVEEHGLEGDLDRWRELRDEIHGEVCERGWSEELGSFTQHYGSDTVDASLLMIPLVGFLPGDDERVLGTLARIEEELVDDGLVLRYRTDPDVCVDGLPEGEGHFLPCSFWYVEALVLANRADEAERVLERVAGLAGELGLLPEEYDPHAGRFLGNYPQAFSHLALVSAALCLAEGGGGGAARARSR
jgi:GH15 family glucan-1,4-alpha-glucosidase